MHEPAPTSERTQSGPAVPPCIAFLLSVARALLGYGRHLDKIFPDGAAQPGFPQSPPPSAPTTSAASWATSSAASSAR